MKPAIFLLLAGLAAPVAAADPAAPAASLARDTAAADPMNRIEESLSGLTLTPAQQQAVAALVGRHAGEAEACEAKLAKARRSLLEAVYAARYNEEAVRAAARDVAKGEEEAAVLRARMIRDLRQELTPDQNRRIDQAREELIGAVIRHAHRRSILRENLAKPEPVPKP